MTTITTRALLAAEAARTGLTEPVLLRIVAKSALIRHVAGSSDGADFVLKGGTLLHHVYDSPRFSVKDADFTYRDSAHISDQRLNAALTVDEPEFAVDFSTVVWDKDQAIWSAEVGYKIGGAHVPAGRQGLSITVSLRLGEWLDPHDPVMYRDAMLEGVAAFRVNGLTLEELAAEKILAWCTKLQAKHAADLAYLARDHTSIDVAKVRDLTERKFEFEKHMPRYRNNGIQQFADLARTLASPAAFLQLQREWVLGDLLLPSAERSHPRTLRTRENVEAFLRDFWQPVLR